MVEKIGGWKSYQGLIMDILWYTTLNKYRLGDQLFTEIG